MTTKRFAWLPFALLVPLAFAGCKEPEAVPPTFQVFKLTDKFFDVQDFGDGKFLALGYRTKVLRTEDSGITWEILHAPIQANMTRFEFVDDQRGLGVGHGGKVFLTTDGGATWDIGSSGAEYSLFDVDLASESVAYGVGDKSTFVRTTDAGKTWTAGSVPIFEEGKEIPPGVRPDQTLALEDPIYYGVEFLDENLGWIVGEYGQIRHTTDGGETWDYQHGSLLNTRILYKHIKDTPPVRDVMTFPTFFHVRFHDPMNGVAVGTYGAIISTDDGGETWRFNESPVRTPLYEVQLLEDGDALLVGSSGVIVRGNAKDGWTKVELPAGIYTWIDAVEIASSGNGVAAGGYGTILTTDDFGQSWSQILYQ